MSHDASCLGTGDLRDALSRAGNSCAESHARSGADGRFAPQAVGGPEGQFTTNPKDLTRHWAVCAISETTIRDLESRSFPGCAPHCSNPILSQRDRLVATAFEAFRHGFSPCARAQFPEQGFNMEFH